MGRLEVAHSPEGRHQSSSLAWVCCMGEGNCHQQGTTSRNGAKGVQGTWNTLKSSLSLMGLEDVTLKVLVLLETVLHQLGEAPMIVRVLAILVNIEVLLLPWGLHSITCHA